MRLSTASHMSGRQYEALGKPVVYMPLGYCDEVHRPLASDDRRWSCAVGFLGGWEPRREHLLHAVAATGIDLKIWGGLLGVFAGR